MHQSTCKKVAFNTSKEAKERLDEIRLQDNSRKQKLIKRRYRCDDCGKYHLTSMAKGQQKRVEYVKENRVAILASKEAAYWAKKKGWELT